VAYDAKIPDIAHVKKQVQEITIKKAFVEADIDLHARESLFN
jgi:hypothetical protein